MIRKVLYYISVSLFFALFTLAIFWDPIINKFGSIQWDAIGVHFFNLLFSSRTWHLGQFPMWTSYIFNGFPQVADLQVAIFYPANLLIGSLKTFTPNLMEYQLIFHYFLAGFFTFLLARHFSKNSIFSLGAGLVYAFSGFMVGHGSHVGMQNTATWLPLIFLLLVLALEKNKIIYGVFSGFFLGIAILAGHFQMSLYIAYGLGLYFAFDLIWTLMEKIIRKRKLSQQEHQEQQPLSPKNFLLQITTDKSPSIHKKILIIFAVYVMAFLIASIQLLPTYELTSQSQRAAISLEMSQTESLNPDSLWGLIYPNHNSVSFGQYAGPWDRTQNYLFITITILILASLGAIFGLASKNRRKITIFFLILALSSILYSLGKHFLLQKYFYQFVPLFSKVRAPSNMMLLFNLATIGLAAVFWGLATDFSEKKFNPLQKRIFKIGSGLIILLSIASELIIAVSPNELLYARKYSRDITTQPWIAQNIISEYSALDENDKFRVFKVPEFSDNSTQMWQIYAFDGYNPLALERYGSFVDTMVKNADLVDLAGIKYLPCEFIPQRAETLKKVGTLCINTSYYPRTFFVDNYEIADNAQNALEKTSEINPKKTVILEEDPKISLGEAVSKNKNAIISETKPGYWKLSAQTDQDAFLFFGQTHYPGWSATIDGQNAKIFQADHIFQAIFVPKGSHEIIFQFKSPPLKTGLILTILGLIITLISALYLIASKKLLIYYDKIND